MSHLELLRSRDYSVLTLGEIVERLRAGRPLPQRCAAISVDDAYRSFMTDGWPLLKQFGYRATLFVTTDNVGQGDFLGWDDLKLLRQEGVEIGNHSATHPYLLDHYDQSDWADWVASELETSQHAFVRHLGFSPDLFAYPYGEYSPQLADLVRGAGFQAAFAQQSGVISPGEDMYSLPRFPMGAGYTSADEFKSKLSMHHLPVVVDPPKNVLLSDDNPPTLRFYIKDDPEAYSNLKCYVTGRNDCEVAVIDEQAGIYEVRSAQPLTGRRNKYTITASDRSGQQWFWFSQLWVTARRGPVADNPVP